MGLRSRGPAFFTVALIGLALLVLLALSGSVLYTDWLWFRQLGFSSVFTLGLWSRIAVGAASGLILALFLWGNLVLALGGRVGSLPGIIELPIGPLVAPRRIRRYLLWISLAAGAFVGFNVALQWLTVLTYLRQVPFGVSDPVFGRDVGHYVFGLPVMSLVYQYLMFALVLTGLGVLLLHIVTGELSFEARRVRLSTRARVHVSLLAAGVLATKALGYRIDLYRLMYSPRGQVFGAGYTDVNAQAVGLRALTFVALGLAVLLIANVRLRRTNLILGGVAVLIAASFVLGSLYPAFVQQFTVEPDELNKESKYIAHNIEFTRRAWGLDDVAEVDYPVTGDLTWDDLQANSDTVRSIRLWDYQPLHSAYAQLQEIRPYYNFYDVDIDRYDFAGDYRQVALAAREMDLTRLTERTWINQHLVFTHGFGVVMNPVNRSGTEGLPEFWLKDVPPAVSGPPAAAGFELAEPRIYFGELTNDYAIVNTASPEFDYPVGDVNATVHYGGHGGIELSSPLVKLAFALRLRHYQIMLANVIRPDSRIMIYRNVVQRARRIAPFLRYDADPYLVINGARAYWIIDAYTMTGGYPDAEPLPSLGANYVRNSVKVVVDAFQGDVQFYLWDPADPLAATFGRVFPSLFKPAASMPEDIRAHLRYPLDLFSWQAEVYLNYHMRDPVVFYNKEDVWGIPEGSDTERGRVVEPYYLIMRLPGEAKAEFVLLLPLTPHGKANMIAWLAGRADGSNYGKQVVYKFPKQYLVYGPSQVHSRINQDTEISRDLTLWGQHGSEVLRGSLLIIPMDGSILYIQPLYLQAEATRLPELKRVIVVYREKVVMAETLDQALRRVFGEGGAVPPSGEDTIEELVARAAALFDSASQAMRDGNWTEYGRLQTELGQVLAELKSRAGTPAP